MAESRRFFQWEIWDVEWTHDGGWFTKRRPGLLISSSIHNGSSDTLWFAMISTKDVASPFRITLDPADSTFPQTGLKKKCFVFVTNVQQIPKDKVFKRRGRVSTFAAAIVDAQIKTAVKDRIP